MASPEEQQLSSIELDKNDGLELALMLWEIAQDAQEAQRLTGATENSGSTVILEPPSTGLSGFPTVFSLLASVPGDNPWWDF